MTETQTTEADKKPDEGLSESFKQEKEISAVTPAREDDEPDMEPDSKRQIPEDVVDELRALVRDEVKVILDKISGLHPIAHELIDAMRKHL